MIYSPAETHGLLTKADGSEWCSDHDGQRCFSTLARCPCITFAEAEEAAESHSYPLKRSSCFVPKGWRQLWTFHSAPVRMTSVVSAKSNRKFLLLRYIFSSTVDEQQADWGHKQPNIFSSVSKAKVACWALHSLKDQSAQRLYIRQMLENVTVSF